MIDEAYDRAYRAARVELNEGLDRLFSILARLIRRPHSAGETPCAPEPSPPSPSRCR